MKLPDVACHQSGWEARKINNRWCVGMKGNLDTIHDAVIIVNTHTTDEAACEIAFWIVQKYNENINKGTY